MARLKDALLKNGAYAENAFSQMVDISDVKAGQNGIKTNFEGYVSNSSYVRRNMIAVLVEAPKGFNDLPEPDKWRATLKALIELHPQSIEGMNSTLTVEFTETAVGGAGEIQQDISNVTRERSTPTFTWVEKYGKPINAFLTGWITNLMMDPITKIPRIMSRDGARPVDILPDYTGCTVLFFEPDPTGTRVVHAWLSTNMHPTTAGEVVGSRDLTAGGETSEYSVEFTSLTQEGVGVNLMAQTYLDEMNMSLVNPNLDIAIVEKVSQNVSDRTTGYNEQVNIATSEVSGAPTVPTAGA